MKILVSFWERIFLYDITVNFRASHTVKPLRISRSPQGFERGQDSSQVELRGIFIRPPRIYKEWSGFRNSVHQCFLTWLQINITPNEIIEDEGACLSTRVISTASNYLCLVYRGGCFNQIMSESKVIENTSLTSRRKFVSHTTCLLAEIGYVIMFTHMRNM